MFLPPKIPNKPYHLSLFSFKFFALVPIQTLTFNVASSTCSHDIVTLSTSVSVPNIPIISRKHFIFHRDNGSPLHLVHTTLSPLTSSLVYGVMESNISPSATLFSLRIVESLDGLTDFIQ